VTAAPPTRVIAAVVLVNAAGEVLLQLRDDRADITDPACWVVPGGGVEPGEAIEAAARRELYEETGYTAGTLVPVYSDSISRPGLLEQRHFFLSTYDERQCFTCGEGQALRFMSAAEAAQAHLGRGHPELLARIFERIGQIAD
jgi:8-oxo-dGTP diphosphatase